MQPTDPSSNNSAPSISSDQQNLPHPQPPPRTPRQHPPHQARHSDGISVGPLRRRLTSPASSTVGTSPEMATGSLPPNQDATKDREKWRRVTPPERKKLSPEQNKIPEEEETPLQRPAQEEHRLSSEGVSRRLPDKDVNFPNHDTAKSETSHEKSSSRRGIWEWARAGTGRLNIIGRIPHPEWKGPHVANGHVVSSANVANGTQSGSQDDFSIPSTTISESKEEQDSTILTAKAEGLGIAQVATMSPSFSQTKMSSDDLVAAASSTGTPESRVSQYERMNGEHSSPSSTSKDSPPSTPDTPTPQQRKKDTPAKDQDMKADDDQKGVSSPNTKDGASSATQSEGTPRTDSKAEYKTVHLSNTSAKKNKNVQNGSTGSPQVPTFKIALAPNLLSGSA
jgi:hypothetical protein